ncbi:MAG TPA: hypothetical protein VFK89_11730, partial [Actinomycetota bacterium]|nr:hypothetical protein [Actinomycetota bacterium]
MAPVRANRPLSRVHINAQRSGSSVRFGSPSIVDPVHAYGEPDYRISPLDGTAYASGPWGTGTQRSVWNRSTDGGRTFLAMHNPPIQSSSESATTIAGPGGGDTEISIDNTGKVYYADLAALASLKMATWENSRCEDGCPSDTLQTQTIANPPQNINGYDRQWFALWDPEDPQAVRDATGYTGPFPVNYLLFAEALAGTSCASGSCESASYSTDGLTYSDSTMSYDMQNDGPLVIEQSTGTVIEGISVDSLNDVGVAILTRDPANPDDPALKNSRIVKVADLPGDMTDRALFPVPALDNAGNLYLVWVTRSDQLSKDNPKAWQIWYAWSKKSSNWTDWSRPIKLSSAPSNTNVMPWATAGANGRLAVVWYGTDDQSHNPSTEGAHQEWNVYLNVVTNAASTSPNLHQQRVTRHPMHYGTVCLEGTGCIAVQGNRNLADFFEVTTDPRTGQIVIVYDDTSNDITQTVANGQQVGDSAADHKGAPIVTVALQNGGVGLLGRTIHGAPRGGTKMRDRKDDAAWDPIYGADNVPQLDLRNAKIKRMKKSFRIKLKVGQLSDFSTALGTTGSA